MAARPVFDPCQGGEAIATPRTAWMSGGWGVRIAIPGGRFRRPGEQLSYSHTIDQVAALSSVRWVMLSVTEPSFGGFFTTYDGELDSIVPEAFPDSDLLLELIEQARSHGLRVLVYVASQGPELDFVTPERASHLKNTRRQFWSAAKEIETTWSDYLTANKDSSQSAFAAIIRRISNRFGDRIDGWWFDHGQHGRSDLLIPAARSGNEQALVAWNQNHRIQRLTSDSAPIWTLTASTPGTDFTDGHVSPTRNSNGDGRLPWWSGNDVLVRQVETCSSINGRLPHVFVPAQSTWRGGPGAFPVGQAVNWTKRVVEGGGAMTWAVALDPPEFSKDRIRPDVYSVLLDVDKEMVKALGERPSNGVQQVSPRQIRGSRVTKRD